MACIPIRNNVVSWQRLDSGVVRITYRLVLKPFLASLLERFGGGESAVRPMKTLELDEMGSEVWELLDGSRTTADLIREFAGRHGLSPREAEQSITLFLRELGKRGLIALR